MALVRRSPLPTEWPSWFGRTAPELFRWSELADLPDLDELGMRLEEVREDDSLIVRAEMPGIDPDQDVEITVANDTLTICAEREQKTENKENDRVRSEFRYGRFSRRLPLPAGTTEDDIEATYRDGILEVRVPIEEARTNQRKIPVKTS